MHAPSSRDSERDVRLWHLADIDTEDERGCSWG